MLSVEENELLCRVGPRTPMGELFRQYWLPAMLSSELPGPDCDQLRVMLLSEQLIGFRDSNGDVGLVANACPHRGASLFFGRNEECGLRCIYHGWKFDVTGQCIDMPSEPAQSSFQDRVRVKAYPTVERGGIIWAYLGPRSTPPPLPDIEGNMDEKATASAFMRSCNWMQALEGDIDTVHASWLHFGHIQPDDPVGSASDFMRFQLRDRAPTFSALDAPWGTSYAAFNDATEDEVLCRQAHFFFPCFTAVAQNFLMANRRYGAWVPMDDCHVMRFTMSAPPLIPESYRTLRDGVSVASRPGGDDFQPRSTDWFGRFRPVADVGNDYLLDRNEWRAGTTYSGLPSVIHEDTAVTESMGPIYNRANENLGTSDVMIIRTRHRLIEAAMALRDEGTLPPGVDDPGLFRQRSGGILLRRELTRQWFKATAEQRRAFVSHSPEAIRASFLRDYETHRT
jgi:phthalate 4,5-dioxygenase